MIFGGIELLFIFVFLMGVASLALGVWAAIDAGSQPEWAFERAGTSKTLWIVLPIAGIVACGLISIVAAIMWFSSTKPKVIAAAQGGPAGPPPGWSPSPPG